MGLFSPSGKVAPAPRPVIATLPVETLNTAGPAETAAFIAKYPRALEMVEPGELNGLLETATKIETASEGGTVVAIRIQSDEGTVVFPEGEDSLFSSGGRRSRTLRLNVQRRRTQRNRRNRVGRKARKLATRRR